MLGQEGFVGVPKGAVFLAEIGNGFAAPEGIEEPILGEEEDGLGVSGGIGLFADLQHFGVLPEGGGLHGIGIVGGAEAAEAADAGVEAEATFGAWFGKDVAGFGVGGFGAEAEDELLVLDWELFEFVFAFHGL